MKDLNKKLITAVLNHGVSKVRAALDAGADINAQFEDGYTPLICAAFWGKKDSLTLLLQRGAQVDLCDSKGASALTYAVQQSRNDMVPLLIKAGADINLRPTGGDEKGRSPVHIAASTGNSEILKQLIDAGANVHARLEDGSTALFSAVTGGNPEALKMLIQAWIDLDVSTHGRPRSGMTAMLLAAWNYRPDLMQILRKAGARKDVHLLSTWQEEDYTILMKAAKNCHIETVRYLAEIGVDLNVQNRRGTYLGYTALIWAAAEGNREIAEILINGGADLNLRTAKGATALMLASVFGRTATAKLLMDRGADLNLQNQDGMTALLWAASGGHASVVDLLIRGGAKTNIAAHQGEWQGCTAEEIANRKGFSDIMQILGVKDVLPEQGCAHSDLVRCAAKGDLVTVLQLLKSGADPNLQDSRGFSALIAASENGYPKIVEALIKAESHLDLRGFNHIGQETVALFSVMKNDPSIMQESRKKDGNTALVLAAANCHVSIVEMLIKAGADVSALCYGLTALERVIQVLMIRENDRDALAILKMLKEAGSPESLIGN